MTESPGDLRELERLGAAPSVAPHKLCFDCIMGPAGAARPGTLDFLAVPSARAFAPGSKCLGCGRDGMRQLWWCNFRNLGFYTGRPVRVLVKEHPLFGATGRLVRTQGHNRWFVRFPGEVQTFAEHELQALTDDGHGYATSYLTPGVPVLTVGGREGVLIKCEGAPSHGYTIQVEDGTVVQLSSVHFELGYCSACVTAPAERMRSTGLCGRCGANAQSTYVPVRELKPRILAERAVDVPTCPTCSHPPHEPGACGGSMEGHDPQSAGLAYRCGCETHSFAVRSTGRPLAWVPFDLRAAAADLLIDSAERRARARWRSGRSVPDLQMQPDGAFTPTSLAWLGPGSCMSCNAPVQRTQPVCTTCFELAGRRPLSSAARDRFHAAFTRDTGGRAPVPRVQLEVGVPVVILEGEFKGSRGRIFAGNADRPGTWFVELLDGCIPPIAFDPEVLGLDAGGHPKKADPTKGGVVPTTDLRGGAGGDAPMLYGGDGGAPGVPLPVINGAEPQWVKLKATAFASACNALLELQRVLEELARVSPPSSLLDRARILGSIAGSNLGSTE